jgi:hypothetical protein
MRIPRHDLCVEPGDSSGVGPQPWLPGSTNLPPLALINNSTAAAVEWHPRAQSRSSAAIPPALAADAVGLIVVDLLGSDDGPESHVAWRLGQYAERGLLARPVHVRWA